MFFLSFFLVYIFLSLWLRLSFSIPFFYFHNSFKNFLRIHFPLCLSLSLSISLTFPLPTLFLFLFLSVSKYRHTHTHTRYIYLLFVLLTHHFSKFTKARILIKQKLTAVSLLFPFQFILRFFVILMCPFLFYNSHYFPKRSKQQIDRLLFNISQWIADKTCLSAPNHKSTSHFPPFFHVCFDEPTP